MPEAEERRNPRGERNKTHEERVARISVLPILIGHYCDPDQIDSDKNNQHRKCGGQVCQSILEIRISTLLLSHPLKDLQEQPCIECDTAEVRRCEAC